MKREPSAHFSKPKEKTEAIMTKQFFAYSTGLTAVAAVVGATATDVISIQQDANFELQYLTYSAEQASLLVLNWAGLVQIDDSGAGRTFFDQAIPINCIAGTGAQPFVFLTPRLVQAGSSLTVTFTNRVATATTVNLILVGYKLYE